MLSISDQLPLKKSTQETVTTSRKELHYVLSSARVNLHNHWAPLRILYKPPSRRLLLFQLVLGKLLLDGLD